jgi:hypothetical protein
MSFFNSEIIQSELKQIQQLQENIASNVFRVVYMNSSEKNAFLDKMERLLELQKIMVTRLRLSESPEAKQFEEEVTRNAQKLGYGPDITLNEILNNMSGFIEKLRKST